MTDCLRLWRLSGDSKMTNLRGLLFVVLTLLVPSFALATAETLYVRPPGSCTFNGDGTAYACATSTGARGAYIGLNLILWNATDETAGRVDPGDMLYVCGTHLISSASYRITPPVSGTVANVITISGACPNDPGVLNGGNASAGIRLVNLGSAGPIKYITISSLTFQNVPASNDYALFGHDNGAGGLVDRYITISHNTFDKIGSNGMWLWGSQWTVTNNRLTNIGNDAIYIKGGKNSTVTGNYMARVSQTAALGDCIQFDSATTVGTIGTGTVTVSNNICDKSTSPNVKYGILLGPVDGLTIVESNAIYCPLSTTLSSGCNPIYINANGPAQTARIVVRKNFVSKGWRGITIAAANNTGFRHQLVGNVMQYAGTFGAWLDANTDNVDISNNTFRYNGQYGLYLGKVTTTHKVTNNIFANNVVGMFYLNSPGNGRTYNDWFGNTTNIMDVDGAKTIDATDYTANPVFVSSTDVRLQRSSALHGAGIRLGSGCIDLRGFACNSPPDLGAYQVQPSDP